MSQLWSKVKASLSELIPEHSFRMWIEPLEPLETEPGVVRLVCPNTFFMRRIRENFSSVLQSELQRHAGASARFDLTVARAASNAPQEAHNTSVQRARQLALPNMAAQPHLGRLLRDDYTFDQFVVGKSNDFAYSAALSLAVRKNTHQSSLFLLSKTGMGKSHLSQAIGHQILSDSPKERVYYMTAEDFTNEMVSSYKANAIGVFKEKYHKLCDVLLLEDVHHLSGKDRTQVELSHTLDSLINENKKIIFSSCYAPSDIPKLNESLRSRLTCGLISNIDAPDYRMRLKILKKAAQACACDMPSEVMEYLASELSHDIRQLKSGLIGVTTKASLLGCPMDMQLAASVVKNIVNDRPGITINSIKKLVCKYYNISPLDIVSKSRKQAIVRPRQIAIYLARRYTDQPLQSIGKSFNRYHATALHAIGAVERGIRQGAAVQRHVEYLSRKLESGDY